MLPYASDLKLTKNPVVTWTLLAVFSILWICSFYLEKTVGIGRVNLLFLQLGITPAHFHPLTLFTYMFLHASWVHLLVNLFYLWVFGAGVEEAVGRGKYLLLFIASGVLGGLLQTIVYMTMLPLASQQMPIVGASAACAGLMGIFAVRYYRAKLAFVGLPFRPQVVAVVGVFLSIEILLGLYFLATNSAEGGVAHWAHVGGFVFGLAFAQFTKLGDAAELAYLNQDATQAMAQSVPGAAIKKWELLMAKDPTKANVRVELARAWLLLGDLEHASQRYLEALHLYLSQNLRSEAAQLYVEIRSGEQDVQGTLKKSESRASVSAILIKLTPTQLFQLANALEERKDHVNAAELFRAVTVSAPESPEAETAQLKAITLYIRHLGRKSEADILIRLFLDRYPHSPFRALAEDLKKEAKGQKVESAEK